MKKIIILCSALCLFNLPVSAQEETFYLKDGRIISGKIISVSGETITLRTRIGIDLEDLTFHRTEIISEELQKLLEIANNKNEWVWDRSGAIAKIAEKGDTSVIFYLMKLTESKSDDVKGGAIIAIGSLKDTRAIPALQSFLKDKNPEIAKEARRALEKMGVSVEKIELETAEKEFLFKKGFETDPIKAINNTLLFQTERRDPAFACFLSMATLGGGQIYNYQPHKGIVAYIIGGISIGVILSRNQTGMVFGEIGLLGTWIWSLFDSYNSAIDINKALEYKYKIEQLLRY